MSARKRATNGKKSKSWLDLLPPRPLEEAHQRFSKWLDRATDEEVFQSLVDAGIYTKTGRLRKPYAPQPDDNEPLAAVNDEVESQLPAHIDEAEARKLHRRIKSMSSDEFFQTLVDAGIYTKSGRLRSHRSLAS